jgi:PAS domain S-box-containing protein
VSTPTIKVLHVDDDYSFITVSKSILEEEPFKVDTASTVDDALTALKTGQYDVIISDYEIPIKNGLDFLKELREKGADIPFILFTGKGREEIAVKALNLGADRYIDKHGDPKVVFTELTTSIHQLYEKTRAKRLLWESEERFKTMVTNVNGIIMLTRKDGIALYVSPSVKTILGYDPQEIIGLRPWAMVYHEDAQRMAVVADKILSIPGYSGVSEYRLTTKEGQVRWVNHSYSQILENGQITQVVSVISDITERKKAQDILKESEEKFSAAFHSSGTASCLTRVEDGLFIDANDCFLNFYGYTRAEVIGNTVGNLRLYADPKKREEIRKRTLNNEPVINIELEGRRKDGKIVPHLFSTKIVNIKGEKYFLSTIVDTSALKKASDELSLSQKQLHDFIGMVPDAVTITDVDGRIIFNNELAGKAFGIPPEKVKGMHAGDFIVESERQDVLKVLSNSAINDQVITRIFHGKRTNGEIFPVDGSAKALRNELGNVTGFIIITKDITEKTTKEEKLIAAMEAVSNSEKQLRVITDAAMDAIIMIDVDTSVSFWNPAAQKMFGYSFEEVKGQNFHKIIAPPKYLSGFEKGFMEFIKSGKGPVVGKTIELSAKRKDGEEFPIELSLSALKVGTSWKAVGIVRDISERKKTEQKLRESEERYRFVAEHANDIITVTDVNGVFRYVSPSIKSVTGLEPEHLIGKRNVMEFLGLEVVSEFNPKMEQLVKTGKLPPLQFQINTPKGLVWLETSINLVRDESGQMSFNAISRDITQRKLMEDKLKESEERYRLVGDYAQDIITVTDLVGNFYYVSPSMDRLLGYKQEELVGKIKVTQNIHLDDIENFRKHIRTLPSEKELPPVEFRFRAKNGDYKWLEAKISTVQDNAKDSRFITISRDVTQRNKDREERDRALLQAERVLEKLSVVGGFVRHDIRNKLTNITNTLYMSKKYAAKSNEMVTYLDRIDDATRSIIRILEFSQTYEAAGSQGLSWIKVKGALQNAQSLFAGIKTLEIETRQIGFEVLADSALTEIFHNLIDNSIKYSAKNPVHITIHTKVAKEGNLQLIYEDNGAGIDASIKKELFKKGMGKGTGLGLYLIWRICEVYGWTIGEDGEQGKGARFVIEIPKNSFRQYSF